MKLKDACSLEEKLWPTSKSRLKSRDITLPTKVRLVKAMVFPAVMYGYESWIIKKVEHQRIGASELWCWRRLLIVTWTARRSNHSILKEIGTEYSLEGLMLKLKLQSFGHLMHWQRPWRWKQLKAREGDDIEDEAVGWHHQLNGHEFEQAPEVGDGQGSLVCCMQSMWLQKVRHDWVTELKWATGKAPLHPEM